MKKKPRGGALNVYVNAKIYGQVEALADKVEMSKGEILRTALLNLLASNAVREILRDQKGDGTMTRKQIYDSSEREPKYTFDDGYQAHLGVTGQRTCIIPDQVADDQKAYDGKTFPAIISRGYDRGKKIRVRLNGDDYDLHGSGTGDTVVRPA